ncbi:MAG: OmpA family protein [Hyphomonas sp.]
MTVDSEQSEQETILSVRRYCRVEREVLPFLPFGLAPVLGLLLLLLFGWLVLAPNAIQDTARRTAQSALIEAGEDWAGVRASGQWITLHGAPPSPEAAQRAIDAVRRKTAPTWLGGAHPATRVLTDFTATASAGPERANSLNAVPVSATSLEYLFRLRNGALVLNGRVPSGRVRADLMVRAENLKSPPRFMTIVNQLEVTGETAPEGFAAAAARSIDALVLCQEGTSSFVDMTFNFFCEADDDKVEDIRQLVTNDLPYGSAGTINVLPKDAVANCEEELARLLDAARIEFASGSVVINVASGPVLDLAARAAADCPGTLRVEGHTDSTGNPDLNDELSQLRAEAVRAAMIDRGVPADRLIAAGYGAARPIGDNATEEGRARNRRIELRIVRHPE